MRRPGIAKCVPGPRTWVGTDAKVVRHVYVCGNGHLATATRIELQRLGIKRDTDDLLPSLRPALVIACADSEADQSFSDVAQQVAEDGSPLLLCCLAGRVIRLGPLIDPWAKLGRRERPSRLTDAHRPASESRWSPGAGLPDELPPGAHTGDHLRAARATDSGQAEADPRLTLYARLGALLVSAQALNFLLGARNQCVLDRVVELNPWSMYQRVIGYFRIEFFGRQRAFESGTLRVLFCVCAFRACRMRRSCRCQRPYTCPS